MDKKVYTEICMGNCVGCVLCDNGGPMAIFAVLNEVANISFDSHAYHYTYQDDFYYKLGSPDGMSTMAHILTHAQF